MKRREFIALFSGAAAWPRVARAQQAALPVVGFLQVGSADAIAHFVAAFRKGLNEVGYAEGQNLTVEYHRVGGQFDRLSAVMADLVRRQVAVIVAPGGAIHALAAKAATATVPIVFAVGEDPVQLGLVASLARPGGNATGINTFSREVVTKRLRLLNDLVPKAARIAVLVNPTNTATAGPTIRDVYEAATTVGLQIQILNAATIGEIDPRGGSTSPLEKHSQQILVLIREQPDLTLNEIVSVLHRRRIPASRSALSRFFARHGITFKKKPAGGRAQASRRGSRAPTLDSRARLA